MTFEQFQATRRECDDLGKALDDATWDAEGKHPGLLYLDVLYIGQVMPWWPEDSQDRGKWHLQLDRDEWITDDLESLERRLYQFALSAGYEIR